MTIVPAPERFGPAQMLRELLALPVGTLVKVQHDELLRIRDKGSRNLKNAYAAYIEVQYKHYIIDKLSKTYNCSLWKN